MKFSIKDFFSKWDQIHSFLRIWSHLLKESLTEDFIFCAVLEEKFEDSLTTKTTAYVTEAKITKNYL